MEWLIVENDDPVPNGLDDIGFLLANKNKIEDYENTQQ